MPAMTMFEHGERDDEENLSMKMISKQQLTHDTWMITFEFEQKHFYLGLLVTGHLNFEATIDGKLVVRRYTPVSPIT